MADITSVAVGGTTVGANFEKHVISNGLGARTLIIKLEDSNMTDAELKASIAYLTTAGGSGNGSDTNGPDAGTIVGLTTSTGAFESGVSDDVTLALQTTTALAGSSIKSGLEALAGVTTATILADFDQKY
jgi:hypothetical protein